MPGGTKILDENGLLYYHTAIKGIFVQQESGKGLSTNDYTTTEKSKLSGIEAEANKTVVDSTLSNSSANPVQNQVVKAALDSKVDAVSGKGLSTNDYTDAAAAAVATIGDKVDKVTGKGLSTNDYTDAAAAAVATIGDKVDKVSGKGLSTNDYTNADAAAVATIGDKVDKVTGKGLSTNDYTTEEKTKLAAFQAASNYALKTDLTSLYKYKGSVATYSLLPSSGQTVGDVWNVETDGMNYAWNGSAWDALGASFSVAALTNEEIADIIANSN